MNYTLNTSTKPGERTGSMGEAFRKLWPLIAEEKRILVFAFAAILINSLMALGAPLVIGRAVDLYVQNGNYRGVLVSAAALLVMYAISFVASYLQTISMGGVGQRVLFRLRNTVFAKLQELPVAFFNQNKAGDLISRINNDTDKLNQFFSQSLMQFIGSVFLMIGAGIFLIVIHPKLGSASLIPAVALLIFTRLTSGWVKRKNAQSMKALGGMSAEIQESLNNFKVIVAFNRRDYFRTRFQAANQENYTGSIGAGLANTMFVPVYGLSSNIAQLIVLALGIYFILTGQFTLGLLISFLAYVNNFYNPLRQLAALWSSFQVALAGWDRISEILSLQTDLTTVPSVAVTSSNLMEFRDVSFRYPDGKEVLHNITFNLEKGKTYALVGPTGGGKTTTASLMARLYDPTEGTVVFAGMDLRAYSAADRAQKIGFILQEPFLFTGTVRENILYGNTQYQNYSVEQLQAVLKESSLENLLVRFEQGLDTPIAGSGDAISLGQKQLIAFMRAVLRHPDILILDEATANIDTVTEQLLQDILTKLPAETTRVIIAHRLNTIENADEIFFVNGGEVTQAGSFAHAMELLSQGKRKS